MDLKFTKRVSCVLLMDSKHQLNLKKRSLEKFIIRNKLNTKKKNRENFSWFGFIAKITSYERTFTIDENNLLTKLYKNEYINYFSNVIIVYRIYCIKGKFSKIKLIKFYIRFTLFQEERLINLPYYHLRKEFNL